MASFKLFINYVRNQLKTKIKVVHSDFGGEFSPFSKYMNELGIMHRLTYPHTSHQNGFVGIMLM